jgi:hypothetical protein
VSRSKQVSRLTHQFGRYFDSPDLNAGQLCEAFVSAGLIEISFRDEYGEPVLYHETEKLRKQTPDAFVTSIQRALQAYCKAQGLVLRFWYPELDHCKLEHNSEFTATMLSCDLEPRERRALGLRRDQLDVKLEVVCGIEASGWRDETEICLSGEFSVWNPGNNTSITLSDSRFADIDSFVTDHFDYGKHDEDFISSASDYDPTEDR